MQAVVVPCSPTLLTRDNGPRTARGLEGLLQEAEFGLTVPGYAAKEYAESTLDTGGCGHCP
jgi:hypothetical protein